ncbi:UV damage endonuclease UvsE [Thalassobacillus devorans]|uniref:UV damage endonuclease UvsE n=1 Tax=Thalassobacillus devorans TaxID=279813 RepID=A0ABQ1P098_9BACI|nr:UV DNA damage repair endonuclease UvsE [Thalassobacillus devorans]NIK28155.1 UV DNA damage endonuclease [Thalassobacillus devorans]GGC88477.1 UV damage endonuclease UvsE [Thalassobacillus devorans]
MTLFQLGYVAMSKILENASPSQTMTYSRFRTLSDQEAAIRRLEAIARSNLHNTLRLLKHNEAHDIKFFRMSSRLIPLATHEDLRGWRYITALKQELKAIGDYARAYDMRVDFHPDHFVVINTPEKEVFQRSMVVLKYHFLLLHAMGIDPTHRCVLHLGGRYQNKEQALENFIENWTLVPSSLQKMIILENDDKSFTLEDCLYVCEKLNIPLVFDLHHHLANHKDENWTNHWNRVVHTWEHSPLPLKMHISSPKNAKMFKSHADFIDPPMFLEFIKGVNGTVPHIDCMIEAKQKDQALFRLIENLSIRSDIEMKSKASFIWVDD